MQYGLWYVTFDRFKSFLILDLMCIDMYVCRPPYVHMYPIGMQLIGYASNDMDDSWFLHPNKPPKNSLVT